MIYLSLIYTQKINRSDLILILITTNVNYLYRNQSGYFTELD